MITRQYLVRLELKYETPPDLAEELVGKCLDVAISYNTLRADGFDGMQTVGAAAYVEIVVADKDDAKHIDGQLTRIIGPWLVA
jgi:hypothetical protein